MKKAVYFQNFTKKIIISIIFIFNKQKLLFNLLQRYQLLFCHDYSKASNDVTWHTVLCLLKKETVNNEPGKMQICDF